MNEMERVNQTAVAQLEIGNLTRLEEPGLDWSSCQKYPYQNLIALGAGFEPIASLIQKAVGNQGGSGLYWVNTKGKTMFQFKDGSGYTGSLMSANGGVGGGQAILNQISIDPVMLSMGITLLIIEQKLDAIQAVQQEILDFLQAKERAQLRGNINTLVDILNHYKFNWNNETYKTNKHVLVQEIHKEAETSIQLYREQIRHITERKGIVSSDQEVNSKLKKAYQLFKDYQLAMHQFAFSSFLEVMLLENFDRQYLDSVIARIEELNWQYRELYTDVYNYLESLSKGSIQTTLSRGVSGITKKTGAAIAKIPVVSKGPVDEALLSVGDRVQKRNDAKATHTMQLLTETAHNCVRPFVESIHQLQFLYNAPVNLAFDSQNIYLFPQ